MSALRNETNIAMTLVKVVLLFLVPVLHATPSFSQGEPTKEATEQFILSKLSTAETHTSTIFYMTYSFEDCDFVWKHRTVINPADKDSRGREDVLSSHTVRIPLKAMDPARVEAVGDMVALYATADKKVISSIGSDRIWSDAIRGGPFSETTSMDSHMGFTTLGRREAEQLARAFSHIIRLCGGQSELF